jgi:hypothetical protein
MCDFESGVVFVERALMRNPNLAFAWFASAWNWMLRGDPGKVVRDFTHVMRLSPLDPFTPSIRAGMALGYFVEASTTTRRARSLAELVLREKSDCT